MSPLCIVRAIVRSWRIGAFVSGHDYVEQEPEKGQPACVIIIKCSACGTVSIGWRECSRCSAE